MFRGNIPTRVDEKGRLKLPADFKRQVEEEYGPRFYITSVDGKRARLYPMKEWEAVEASLMKMSPMDPVRERFLDVTTYYGQMVEMDAQGRLLIPQLLRDLAMIKDDVEVMGKIERLEVVKKEVFQGQLDGTGAPAAIQLSREDLASYAEKTMPKVA
jgi:MraZ protein